MSTGKSKWRAFYSQHYGALCTVENAAALLLACGEGLDDSEIAASWDSHEDMQHHKTVCDDDEVILIVGSEEEDCDEELEEF
jgi:hypothetical protein